MFWGDIWFIDLYLMCHLNEYSNGWYISCICCSSFVANIFVGIIFLGLFCPSSRELLIATFLGDQSFLLCLLMWNYMFSTRCSLCWSQERHTGGYIWNWIHNKPNMSTNQQLKCLFWHRIFIEEHRHNIRFLWQEQYIPAFVNLDVDIHSFISSSVG